VLSSLAIFLFHLIVLFLLLKLTEIRKKQRQMSAILNAKVRLL